MRGRVAFVLTIATVFTTAHGDVIDKANNVADLRLGSSWKGGVAPTANDVAQWSVTVTGANTVALGADLAWKGIALTNPGGAVTINGNILTLGASGISIASGLPGLTINSQVSLAAAQTWNTASPLGTGSTGAIDNAGFLLTLSGGGTVTLGGAISGSGGLTVNTTVGTTLTAINTFQGLTTVGAFASLQLSNGGFLPNTSGVANSGTLLLNHSDDLLDFNRSISGTGSVALSGAGLHVVSGANSYSGGTKIQGTGTLKAGSSSALGAANGSLNFSSAGTVDLAGNSLAVGLLSSSAAGTILNSAPGSTATLTIGSGNIGGGNFTGSLKNNSGTGGTLALTKTGTAQATLSGANSYSGATLVNSGTLVIGSAGALSANTQVSVADGAQLGFAAGGTFANSMQLAGSKNVGAFDPALSAGALRFTADQGVLTLSGPLSLAATGSTEVASFSSASTINLQGPITGGDGSGAFYLGAGGGGSGSAHTFVLSHAGNSYAGSTILITRAASATLQLSGGDNRLPVGTTLVLQAAGGTAAVFDLHGWSQQLAGLTTAAPLTGSAPENRVLTTSAAANQVLTISGSASTTFAGILGGAAANNNNFALIKTGAGAFTLSAANTYSGKTEVSGGSLIVSGSLTGTAVVEINSGGTLGGSGSVAPAGDIALRAGGKLSPGNADVGPLTATLSGSSFDISAGVAANGSASLLFELGAPGQSDSIVTRGGALVIGANGLGFDDFVFTLLSGFAPGSYTLFDGDTAIGGTLDSAARSGSFAGGLTGTLLFADSNRDIVLLVVPEPSAAWLLLAGAGLLLIRSRNTHNRREATSVGRGGGGVA